VFGYFDCFNDYAGMEAADVGYDFCFISHAVSGSCRMFGYWFSQPGVSYVFCNPGGDVTAGLANVPLPQENKIL
jgi:hypothetical protein